MPQLREEGAPGLVDGVDDRLPCIELGFCVQPWGVGIPSHQASRKATALSLQSPDNTGEQQGRSTTEVGL